MAGNMSSYGAYYYSSAKPESRTDAPSRREEVRSPAPSGRYSDRPGTAARGYQKRRSITPPDGERGRPVPYYQQEMERPGNPGSNQERTYQDYRPVTAYQPASSNQPFTPQEARPPERKRAESPDPSIFSEISEPEIKPNYSSVDYYTYSKCLERVISDPNLAMPVRLGVVGKWGAGKSKIMQGILWCLKQACDTTCSHLTEPVEAPTNIRWQYRTCYCCDMSFFTYLFLLFVLLLVGVACVLLSFLLGVAPYVIEDTTNTGNISAHLAIINSATTTPSSPISQETIALIVTVSLVALLLFVICIAGMFKCLKDRYMRGSGEMMAHFRALVIMALCDVPPPPQTTTEKVDIIPICFNASEFSGTKDSWSALTIHILSQCESMFGFWKSRFYRICAKDLEHEHDFLIADEDKWRRSGHDKHTVRAQRSLASALPMNSKLPPNLKQDLNANRSPKPQHVKSQMNGSVPGTKVQKKPSFIRAVKHNKVVATEDMFGKKIDVPVHTAKWRIFGYPMLITIGLVSIISATVILIVIGLGVNVNVRDQIYHYVIISLSITVICIPLAVMTKNLILLLISACTSPRDRIEKLRKQSRDTSSYKRMREEDTQGFMHHVKTEVGLLMGFIRYMEHIYQRRFRILITIDDIEKCPEQTMLDLLNALQVLFGDPSFPVVVMLSIDSEQVIKSLNKAGIESGQKYLNQLLNMRFCVPDSSTHDIVKLLENQAEHLLCSTSVRVNRLRELSEKKYNSSEYRMSRREAIRQLDLQHDYEDRTKHNAHDHQPYYSNPVSARHTSTARSRRTKSSRSKKRVIFTPLKASSEDGLDGTTPQPPKSAGSVPPAAATDKTVAPAAASKPAGAASPPDTRKQSVTTPVPVPTEKRPMTAERPESQLARPDSQLSRVKSPLGMTKSDMRRENSTLAEESSEDEADDEEPDYLLALTAGEARKENLKGAISTRRPQLADSEKTDEQLAEQHIHAVAEMKVLLGVSQGLYTALVTNPSYELAVSYDSAQGSIKNLPNHVNLQNITKEQLKKHISAYGLRRRMIYLALDEVRHSIKLLDGTFTRMTQLFNTVYLSVYIWTQKLKQLGIVDTIVEDKDSDKVMVKLIKTCQELTHWVMLCELWPYRSSWLIYKVERVNRKMGDFPSSSFYLEASIRDIYRDIRPDIRAAREEFELWRSEDYADTAFKKCLERFKDISGSSVLRYLPFTINIDRTYKNAINQYMSAGGGNPTTLNKDDDKEQTKSITFADQNGMQGLDEGQEA